ncbi:hypothetical protein A3Q56_07136, partial [Intoshia linei]
CSDIHRCVRCQQNICISCEEGFISKSRFCEACHDVNCAVCSKYNEICDICKSGYFLNKAGVCVDCSFEASCNGRDAGGLI